MVKDLKIEDKIFSFNSFHNEIREHDLVILTRNTITIYNIDLPVREGDQTSWSIETKNGYKYHLNEADAYLEQREFLLKNSKEYRSQIINLTTKLSNTEMELEKNFKQLILLNK